MQFEKKLLEEIRAISDEFGFLALKNEIEAIENLMAPDSLINVVVLGQFKTGKSSFINDLVGFNLLPTDVIPVTSVITDIKFGEKKEFIIENTDAHLFFVGQHEIKDYIAESQNPLNYKKIKSVTCKIPEVSRFKGLRILDTPGLDSILKHNTEITKSVFSNVGIAIICISSERPLSSSDLLLIKEVKKHTPKIIILLTKVDLFSKDELNNIHSFISKSIHKELKESYSIYHYSVKKENSSYKDRVINELVIPLTETIAENKEAILKHKAVSVTNNCISYLELVYRNSLKTESEKKLVRSKIFDEKMNFQMLRSEVLAIESINLNSTRSKVLEILMKHKADLIEKISGDFEKKYFSWKLNLSGISKKYSVFVFEFLSEELKLILSGDKECIDEIITLSKQHFERFIYSFKSRINEKLLDSLGTGFQNDEIVIQKPGDIIIDLSITRSFDFQIELIWFLFPMTFFRKIFYKHFIRLIKIDVEKNIYRLTSDVTEKINNQIKIFSKFTLKLLRNEIETLYNVLNKSADSSIILKEKIENLGRSLKNVTEICR